MSRYRDNAVRNDEVNDMVAPVQAHPSETSVMNPTAVPVTPHTAAPAPKQWIFSTNRKLGPMVILGFLVVFYFVSPYLPHALREFLVSLR
ncbi:MAG: hypothetical protein ABSE82_14215 [Nitrososphaerales archaeon]